MIARATIFRRVKGGACTFTCHYFAENNNLQLRGAAFVQVSHATCVLAVTRATGWPHTEREIVAVYEADVVKIFLRIAICQGEFDEARWRYPTSCAFQSAAAIPGGAIAVSCGSKAAASSGPEAPGPPRWGRKLHEFTGG